MPFRQFVYFSHSHIISKWHPGSRGGGGEQGQQGENVQFPEIFHELK